MSQNIKIILGIVSIFLAFGISSFVSLAHAQISTFKVVKVVNSNTIVADIRGKNETVKLLGISTPDTTQCFGKAAEDKLQSLLTGKSVILVDDKLQGNRNASGNLIRYVYLPDSKRTFINGEMIKQGYAYSNWNKTKLLSHLNALENYARAHNLGLWEACPINSPTKTYTQAAGYVAPVQHIQPATPPESTSTSTSTIQQSAPVSACAGATAICSDGTCSYSAHHQGTCSHHGGVAQWL